MSRPLPDITAESVLAALAARRGRANALTAQQLAWDLTGRVRSSDQRRLRNVVELLRQQGQPVCAHPAHGYWWAVNDADINDTCAYLYVRAMTSLRQIAAMKRVALPDLRGQLRLPLETTPNE
jgi:hypothetical protein